MVEWKKAQVPQEPTPRAILVTNISPNSNERVVRDFFTFCGKLEEFEVIEDPKTGKKTAFVLFERESAAKTACMLSCATINDTQVIVGPYFKDLPPSSTNGKHEMTGIVRQEEKPKTSIVTELLAAGYILSDQIIRLAQEFDAKYGVSTRVQSLLEQGKAELAKLDERYGVLEKAVEIDSKYHFRSKASFAYKTATEYGTQALQSSPGQTVQEMYIQAKSKVVEMHSQSRDLANRKLSPNNLSPSSTSSQSSNAHLVNGRPSQAEKV